MSIETTSRQAELDRAEAAYTAAVQAAAGNHAPWEYARQAHEVCKQLRARLNEGETA
jgi:hypothetical protein